MGWPAVVTTRVVVQVPDPLLKTACRPVALSSWTVRENQPVQAGAIATPGTAVPAPGPARPDSSVGLGLERRIADTGLIAVIDAVAATHVRGSKAVQRVPAARRCPFPPQASCRIYPQRAP